MMNGYQHLGLDERRDVYRLVATGPSVRQIADALGRHPATIYRELKRNRHLDEPTLGRWPLGTTLQFARRMCRLPPLHHLTGQRETAGGIAAKNAVISWESALSSASPVRAPGRTCARRTCINSE